MKKKNTVGFDLSRLSGDSSQKLEIFALVSLGLVQSLTSGLLTPSEAIERFFNQRNCSYVSRELKSKAANEIMSRGVQLADLFETLKPREARREFAIELSAIRSWSLDLLGKCRQRRERNRAAA